MNRDPKGTPTLPPSEKPDSLPNKAKNNPAATGDPTSMKNETARNENAGSQGSGKYGKEGGGKVEGREHETLSQKALKNPAALGDPISIKAEQSSLVPTDEARGAKGDGKDSKL